MEMMEVGTEFSSWDSFASSLEQYSRQNEVVYTVDFCKPVELLNKKNALKNKFPQKFKYCFARMQCNHNGKNVDSFYGQQPQRLRWYGCKSSIVVSVKKNRTALVVIEADLTHTHTVPGDVATRSSIDRNLSVEERRIACVLLRAGVPVGNVHMFLAEKLSFDRANQIVDVSEVEGQKTGLTIGKSDLKFDFLFDLEKIMSTDPKADVQVLNFERRPQSVYIQTGAMKERIKGLKDGMLQVLTYPLNKDNRDMSVLCILGLDDNFATYTLAVGIVRNGDEKAYSRVLEIFARSNPDFCDSLHGIVLDCSRNNIEFVQHLFPQCNIAWSRTYIVNKFSEETKLLADTQKQFQIRMDLLNSQTAKEYEVKLKELIESNSTSVSKDFLRTWDSCKELWVHYHMHGLNHQVFSVEIGYANTLRSYIKSNTSLSEIIKAIVRFDRSNGQEEMGNLSNLIHSDPCIEAYQQLCVPEASQAVCGQVTVALSSAYQIKEQTDMIFVKRCDSNDEVILDSSGQTCTCQFFMDSELPCQHIFAYFKHCGLPLYNESLISEKWQIFGKSLTLNALADSLSQGFIPSHMLYNERLRRLQTVTRDILTSCTSHSYEQIGKDLTLLTQVLTVLRSCKSDSTKLVPDDEVSMEATAPPESNSASLTVRRRGRPRKNVRGSSQSVVERHNLRTNIKHKFVKREQPLFDSEISNEASREGLILDNSKDSSPTEIGELSNENKDLIGSISQGRVSFLKDVETASQENNSSSPLPSDRVQQSSIHDKDQRQLDNSVDKSKSQQLGWLSSKQLAKRAYSEVEESTSDSGAESDDSEEEEEDEEMSLEKLELKRVKQRQEIDIFLDGMSDDSVREILQFVVSLSKEEHMDRGEYLPSKNPADYLINSCKHLEVMDYVLELVRISHPGFDQRSYKITACLICRANAAGTTVEELLEMIKEWPSHLPCILPSRPLDEEIALNPEQCLTVCGHKLNKEDMETLKSGQELSSNVIHAYLEVLAQKHSGKMFIIPFDVVHLWRQGSYSEKIFKKVHFKTFEFLVLPIQCGAEFTEAERRGIDIDKPCWMALVADVHNKTVCVLNPRTDDKYSIAANGYMLQWRRYMQIRSVHTKEMLYAWKSRTIDCNKQLENDTSGILMLMSVEALICGVHPTVMTEAHIDRYVHYMAMTLRDTDRETTVLCVGGPDCQQLAARDADWLQCENCRTWWHRACAGHSDDDNNFYCSSCQQRIHATSSRLANSLEESDKKDMADIEPIEETEFEDDEVVNMEEGV